STNSFAGCEGAGREILTSWLKMADENETAPQQEKETEIEVDHGHCSNCENEEHHSDDGEKGDTGAKKKKKRQKKKNKDKSGGKDAAQDPLAKVNSLPADKLQEIQKAIELFSVGQGPAKTMEEATRLSVLEHSSLFLNLVLII
ncbi:hypothetical protein cypCar_00037923, partial [Cyprinus carpio]